MFGCQNPTIPQRGNIVLTESGFRTYRGPKILTTIGYTSMKIGYQIKQPRKNTVTPAKPRNAGAKKETIMLRATAATRSHQTWSKETPQNGHR
jgi:hypothetical protein